MIISTKTRFIAAILASTTLAAPAIAGEVTGQVSDASQTRNLQSANVRIVELNRTVSTDRDGRFVFADVPAGDYTLEFSYSGADTVTQTVTVTDTGRVVANAELGGEFANEILVIGQAASFNSALSRQRESDGVSSVLTRDSIGQFPDQNVAESIRRLPGVNILNDQGEGRFVSVRGLDPELNSSSLNGIRLPAPESDVRSVALDVISSDNIESIEIKKSFTPDMDGDFLGASVEINTTSAFDRKKDLLSVKVEGSYNDYVGEVTPKGSFDFATKLSDDVGISGGISYYNRKFETDNVETGGWDEVDGVVYAPEIEYRDYDVERTRLSGNLNADIRASDYTNVFVRGTFSKFDDQEYRRRLIFDMGDFEDNGPSSATGNTVTFDDSDERITVIRDNKDRFESQTISSYIIGMDHDDGQWKAHLSGSWARASELENNSVDPIRFRSRFADRGVVVTQDYSDPRIPAFSVSGNTARFNDPAQYGFYRLDLTELSDSVDEEYAVKGDLGRSFGGSGGEFTVQGGFKARWREKSYNAEVIRYEDADLTLANVLGSATYRLFDLGPVPTYTGGSQRFFNFRDQFGEIDPIETGVESNAGDYSVTEDILAGYALARYDSSTLRVIGGVRVEKTTNELTGNLVSEDGDTVTVAPVAFTREYTDWLPSLTARFAPTDNVVLRLAGSRTLLRPKLSKMAPRFTINEDEEAEFGNPDLLPYEAWNLDASAEYYFGSNGAFTVGAFYKSVDNFIVDAVYDKADAPYNGVYRGTSFEEAVIPENGDKATVFGVEVSYSQIMTFLPAPLDGLLVQANYTYTDAKGTLFGGREITLPSASKHTGNIVIGFEKGPFDLRAAGTYRSRYLDEIGGGADEDRFVDNHFQIDLSAKFKVNDNLRIFAEWINVNDAKYFAYQNFEGAQRLLQYEVYGPTVKFGAKLSF